MKIIEIQITVEFEGESEELEKNLPILPIHNTLTKNEYEIYDIDREEENEFRIVYRK